MADVSHPVWVRGLKLPVNSVNLQSAMSHPVRVRGLKQKRVEGYIEIVYVAPCAGAWIETATVAITPSISKSHPVRVRGLKHVKDSDAYYAIYTSHPVRVRGLKLYCQ